MNKDIRELLALMLAEQRAQNVLLRRVLTTLESLPQQVLGQFQNGAAADSRVVRLRGYPGLSAG
jgi:hypothetical protein